MSLNYKTTLIIVAVYREDYRTTAPIIGFLSIFLLFYTLREQIKFSKKQEEISIDEQFKSTFFSLLQTQRNILEKVSGDFTYLGSLIYEEHSWSKEKKEVKGLDFFKAVRYQLSQIFQALDYGEYLNHYDYDEAYCAEEKLKSQIFSATNMPIEVEQEQNEIAESVRLPFRVAYTNKQYLITKEGYAQYKRIEMPKKIGLAYALFFNKYEGAGYYFRHIYQILKFIKQNEDDKIASLGKQASETDKKEVHLRFLQYAQFIQAQMSIDELLLLFYNSFTFEKTQKLIIHYNLLENLTIQNLIRQEHNCNPELRLKDRNNLYLDMISCDFD